jgi:hypothetical protein
MLINSLAVEFAECKILPLTCLIGVMLTLNLRNKCYSKIFHLSFLNISLNLLISYMFILKKV